MLSPEDRLYIKYKGLIALAKNLICLLKVHGIYSFD